MIFIKNMVIMLSLLMISSVAFASGEDAIGEAAVENNACITFGDAKHYEEVKADHDDEKAREEHDKAEEEHAAEHEAKAAEHEAKAAEYEHGAEGHRSEASDLADEHAPEDSTQCVDASGNAGFLPAAVSSVTGSSAYREMKGQ